MTFNSELSFAVFDAERLLDCVLGTSEGGATMDVGLSDMIREINTDVNASVSVTESAGLSELRDQLESGSSPIVTDRPNIVLLSLAGETARFSGGSDPNEVVAAVRADLVRCIELIKEKAGSTVLVANLSTLDPDNPVYAYSGLDHEPFNLVAHRLNLMLLSVSHDEGISVVDIDRKIAEVGGGEAVSAAARYTGVGCKAIAGEIARIVEDYGFLDDRPLMEQIGARAGSS